MDDWMDEFDLKRPCLLFISLNSSTILLSEYPSDLPGKKKWQSDQDINSYRFRFGQRIESKQWGIFLLAEYLFQAFVI